ncbi:MAG: FtsX-like permease family protein [Acidimicrobiia bacterium]|nr:FtsX-like permease family protein [Acidimicrobiia bacterium]
MHLRALFLRLRALVAPCRVEQELDEELAFHVERDTQRHITNGLSDVDARARARSRFGSLLLAADRCRDVRGTAAVDNVARDVRYAFRTFRRAPLAALTIVGTVALGLGLVAAVFTFFNVFLFRVDAVYNPHELFAVERPASPDEELLRRFTRAEYEALRRETSVFTDAVAMMSGIETRVDGRPVSAVLVTGNFFHVLGAQAVRGRTFTPAENEPSAARRVVLSHEGWLRLLAGDPTGVGRRVSVNGVPCEVIGIMPEDFRGLSVGSPDYWAPLALAADLRPAIAGREGDLALSEVVGRLKPGISPEQATAGLTVWASAAASPDVSAGRPPLIELEPRRGVIADWFELAVLFSPIFFAFGLILMIGCSNVANLLLARGMTRQREIGIRLSLGASRRRIVRQRLTESLVLALAAAACGLLVSRLCLDGVMYAATVTMPGEVLDQSAIDLDVPAADWRVLLFLVAGALVATVFFGLVPALQATRVAPVRPMRGDVGSTGRPGRARNALIAVQVGASALLLICAAVFLRSAAAAAVADVGVRTSDTIRVPIADESRRAAIVGELTADPSVRALAAASGSGQASAFTEAMEDEGAAAPSRRSLPVAYQFVSSEYFELLDINVIRGRDFTNAERTAGTRVAVVSETAARRLWPNGEAIGQAVRIEERQTDAPQSTTLPSPAGAYTVVGVVRDVGGGALFRPFAFSGVYLPIDVQSPGTELFLRVRGDPELVRLALIESLLRIDPALDHEVGTLQMFARMPAYILQLVSWVTVGLGGLALALTVSGLFSVLSYLVEQRARDIGVRMALGATARSVAMLVLSQSFHPVGLGMLTGGGLAAGLATLLLSTPVGTELGNAVRVLDPVAYAVSLLVVVTACALATTIPALRAARIDPIETLRPD